MVSVVCVSLTPPIHTLNHTTLNCKLPLSCEQTLAPPPVAWQQETGWAQLRPQTAAPPGRRTARTTTDTPPPAPPAAAQLTSGLWSHAAGNDLIWSWEGQTNSWVQRNAGGFMSSMNVRS